MVIFLVRLPEKIKKPFQNGDKFKCHLMIISPTLNYKCVSVVVQRTVASDDHITYTEYVSVSVSGDY